MNDLATVVAVHRSAQHRVSKKTQPAIRLIEGLGVERDAHLGSTVKHRSRVAVDPSRPNLRQVHLVHAELLDELAGAGFAVAPGTIGENVTTRGIDLLAIRTGTTLRLGPEARVEITGLRNPCLQLDGIQPGLMQAVLERDAAGALVRKAGVMGIVVAGGVVRPGDEIRIESVPPGALPLAPV